MRLPGDVVFSLGSLLMAWDFIVKLWASPGSDPDRAIAVGQGVTAPGE
jgi:hypothetical protein